MSVLVCLRTRPEAIKLAPVIYELKNRGIDTKVCITAQHREMLDQMLTAFDINPDYDLDLMRPAQNLSKLTSLIIESVYKCIAGLHPSVVIVQGDTTTTYCTALAAYYLRIPVAHVEAGLRSNDRYAPFPEELNRRMTAVLAEWHFAPTQIAHQNLSREGISEEKIFITGNTVVDSLIFARRHIESSSYNSPLPDLLSFNYKNSKYVVVTLHRRENIGDPARILCQTILEIALSHPEFNFVIPVHMNPEVNSVVTEILSKASNIHLLGTLEYFPFIELLEKSFFLVSDSGGVQEEAPCLGKPLLVTRERTERMEGIDAGAVKLVGNDSLMLKRECDLLINDPGYYESMSQSVSLYGDGHAARKIVDILLSKNGT